MTRAIRDLWVVRCGYVVSVCTGNLYVCLIMCVWEGVGGLICRRAHLIRISVFPPLIALWLVSPPLAVRVAWHSMGISLAPGQADSSPASVTYAVDATKADSLIGRVAVDDSSNPDARPVILQASRLSLARVHCWPAEPGVGPTCIMQAACHGGSVCRTMCEPLVWVLGYD